MNNTSSRSHCDLIITVTIGMRKSCFHIIDLAGSERAGKSELTGKTLEQGISINQSLTNLGIVIRDIIEKGTSFNYRSSMLTMILKDALGGKFKTAFIVTISPADYNVEETRSSLEFAKQLLKVTNTPITNLIESNDIGKLTEQLNFYQLKVGENQTIERQLRSRIEELIKINEEEKLRIERANMLKIEELKQMIEENEKK